MDPSGEEKTSANQIRRLNQRIDEVNQLIDDYEREILLLSGNPKVKNRLEQELAEVEEKKEKYQRELNFLMQSQSSSNFVIDQAENLSLRIKNVESEGKIKKAENSCAHSGLEIGKDIKISIDDNREFTREQNNPVVALDNEWPLSILLEYGHFIQGGDAISELNALLAAKKQLNKYYSEFKDKESYLLKFETIISRSISNLNIIFKARNEFKLLGDLADSFIRELSQLNKPVNYPRNDLRRCVELSYNIHNQLNSVAGSIALSKSVTSQIGQIKRMLPTLKKIIQELLVWLNRMSIAY